MRLASSCRKLLYCLLLGLLFCIKMSSLVSGSPTKIDLAATVNLAIENHKSGNAEQALIHYELALPMLANSNTKASLHGNAGALYMQLGNFDKAKEHFQASVDINPKNSQTHFNLAVLLTSKMNQHAKAIKHCKTAINLDPQNYKAQHLMGNILQSIGRPVEAEAYFVAAENIALELKQASPSEAISGPVDLSLWDRNKLLQLNLGDEISVKVNDAEYTVKCVSTSPHIFTIDDLISVSDCEDIISKATGKLEKSFVMGTSGTEVYESGSSESSDSTAAAATSRESDAYRSSYTAWLSSDALLQSIQEKLSLILGLPLPYLRQKSEDLQVVHYHGISTVSTTARASSDVHGGQFKVHHDSSAFHTRYLTALFYPRDIASPEDTLSVCGGETWFPYAGEDSLSSSTVPASVEEANKLALSHYSVITSGMESVDGVCIHDQLKGVRVCPKRGRVVVFFNHNPSSGVLNPLAVHAGLPVRLLHSAPAAGLCADSNSEGQCSATDGSRVGDKWVANYWIDLDKELLVKMNGTSS